MVEFDFSDRTDAQMRAVIVLAGAYKARWAELERAAKESVRERMGFNEHEAAYLGGVRIGEVNRSRPGRGSWKVSDGRAYGAWLAAHGFDRMVEPVPMPTGAACASDAIGLIVEGLSDGEIPDGVAWSAPSDRVSVRQDADALDALFTPSMAGAAMRLIAPPEPGDDDPVSSDSGDSSDLFGALED